MGRRLAWSRRLYFFVGVLVISGLLPKPSVGQSVSASLGGQVSDQQGRAISSAALTLRNILTGTSKVQQSSNEGRFSFDDIPFGSYSLSVQCDGFSDQVHFVEFSLNHNSINDSFQLRLAGVEQVVNVVSASRVEELQENSAAPVNVIDRHQIETSGKENVGTVLAEVPGVVTRNYSSFKQGVSDEQVQGIDSRQVLVLRDGLPTGGARGINSGVIDLSQQSIGSLEQIEVVKGASSAQYGTDAIGGAINLVSREQTAPLSGEFVTSGGSLGTVDLRGSLGAASKQWSGFLDLERHQGNGYRLIAVDPTTTGPQYRQENIFFHGGYKPAEWAQIGFSMSAYHTHDLSNSFTETGLSQGLGNDSEESLALTVNLQPTRMTNLQVRG